MPLDPISNPYTPGAGQRPAVLSGREQELQGFTARLQRLERRRGAQCTLVIGLRGVGKTVLLNRFGSEALKRDWVVVEHELTPSGDLLATLARLTRESLLELSPPSRWQRASRRVAAFLRGMEISYDLAGLSISTTPPDGDGDTPVSGDPTRDVTELLVGLGAAAAEEGRGVALMFDELQFAPVQPLGALVAALHRVAQRELPLTVVAAGLPQTRGVLAEAATCSERMFETRTVGALSPDDARRALAEPAAEEGVTVSEEALQIAVDFTDGYPFFLQVFGDHLWRTASSTVVTGRDAERAAPLVRDWLDRGFFTSRTERLTAAQRRYLRAMAELGGAEHSSGDIAAVLGLTSSAPVGQTREGLIRRGLIYSPRLGYAAFSVPQFDDYLRRHFELEPHTPRRRGTGDTEE
ncbi:ATP-binding protein [Kineococcus gypseus]|uniref:AAA family ATPase n=1 Tax=Kineococcus gypseus TaxID=1637102 RepID=UPI003D7DA0C6